MKKHIIITKLFEFGGSNEHLKAMIKYFGKENVILLLEDERQLSYLKNIEGTDNIKTKIKSNIYPYAHLRYRFTTNIKEVYNILRSILAIQILSLKYGFADVTISSVEPEKYLYLLWLPFCKVIYILHTSPDKKYTAFTSYTCNSRLGERKKVITVSNSNKNLICENWDISSKKRPFIYVIYNCIIESELNDTPRQSEKKSEQNIVTLGHVINYKNPLLWLEVAKLVTSVRKNAHFLWLGNGPLWDDFKEATQELNRITFQGSVIDPKSYLQNAAIYYQPSLYETHGIAVVEAMYNNLPCVVANIGGLPESVQDKHNGVLVDPRNIQENADAIIQLLDNDELRLLYGSNSYKRYRKLFTYVDFKTSMNRVYIN